MSFFDSEKTEKSILLTIALVALGIRLIFLSHFESYIIDNDWAFGYETGRIAKSMSTGEGFSSPFPEPTGPTAWMMPIYPFLLAIIFGIFGSYTTTAAIVSLTVNCLVSAMTCIPIYFIAKTLFGRSVGFLSACGLALYPSSVWHAINTIWDTTIFTFLAMLLLYWFLLIPPKHLDVKKAAFSGFFMGFVALVNSVIIAFYPFMLIWLYLKRPGSKQLKTAYIAVACFLCFLTIMPWVLRNYNVFGRFMIRSNLGLELKLGNSQSTWKALDRIAFESVWLREHPSINKKEFRSYERLGEMNYVDMCFEKALDFIRENPGKFSKLTLKRIYHFWFGGLLEKNEWTGNLKISFSVSWLKKLLYVLPFPFMVAGILFAAKRKREIWLPIGYMLFLPAVYYITHVSERYRYPLEPVILIFASYGFCSLILWLKNSKRRHGFSR